MSYYPTPVPEPPNSRYLRDEFNRIRTALDQVEGSDLSDLEARVTQLEADVAALELRVQALENRYPLTWDGVD